MDYNGEFLIEVYSAAIFS